LWSEQVRDHKRFESIFGSNCKHPTRQYYNYRCVQQQVLYHVTCRNIVQVFQTVYGLGKYRRNPRQGHNLWVGELLFCEWHDSYEILVPEDAELKDMTYHPVFYRKEEAVAHSYSMGSYPRQVV
jgi:hypothetical protein